jgi:hypothetical protein
MLSDNGIMAQTEAGQIVINAGVGESPEFNGDIGSIFSPGKMFPIAAYDNTPYLSDDYPPMYSTSSIIPNIGMTVDYGALKWLSIGIASSYQSEIINWTPADLNSNNGQAAFYPYSDKVTRINSAARLLFHLIRNQVFDFYSGFRFGESYWKDNPYSPQPVAQYSIQYVNPPAYFISKPNLVVGSFQYLWGLRIYPSKYIGVHFEAGIGSPYLVEGGLSIRINTRKRTPGNTPAIATPQENYGGHPIK